VEAIQPLFQSPAQAGEFNRVTKRDELRVNYQLRSTAVVVQELNTDLVGKVVHIVAVRLVNAIPLLAAELPITKAQVLALSRTNYPGTCARWPIRRELAVD